MINNNFNENKQLAFKKKLDLIGKHKIKNILLVQPIQISEKKLDIKISINKRYYMYPPYALGILNTVLKRKNYTSSILDLNYEIFDYIYNNRNCNSSDLTKEWKNILKKKLIDYKPDVVGVSCTFTMNHENMIEIFDSDLYMNE